MNNNQPPQDQYPVYPPPQGGYPPAQQPGGYPPVQPGGGGYGYPPYYPPQPPPKRGANVAAIIAGLVALLAIAALVVVLAVPSVRAAIFPAEATPTRLPTYTPQPTYTKQPTARPTQARIATATPKASDYSSIALPLGVLPEGFDLLTEAEASAMGLDVSSFSESLAAFTDAPVQAMVVGLNSSPDAFQVVVILVAAPLTASEQSQFDLEIADPQNAVDEFAIGMGGDASAWIMPGGDTIGDSSLGMELTMTSSGVTMGGEVLLARRAEALQMVIYLYLEGAQQQVTALNLADAIDYQIQQVQK